MASANTPNLEVLWPLAKKAIQPQKAAARLPDLSGKTIAEVWDYIFRGEAIYPIIRKSLQNRYPGIKFIDYSTFGNFHGATGKKIVAELGDKLRALGVD